MMLLYVCKRGWLAHKGPKRSAMHAPLVHTADSDIQRRAMDVGAMYVSVKHIFIWYVVVFL